MFNKDTNPYSTSIVERANKMLREKLDHYMTHNRVKNYINVLNKLVKNYNDTIHTSTHEKPNNVSEEQEEKIAYDSLRKSNDVKFKIG